MNAGEWDRPEKPLGLTANSESSWEHQTKERKLFVEHSKGDGKS